MKIITLYKCEICGQEHKFKADAERCEKFHQKPVEIVQELSLYSSVLVQDAKPYPHTLRVKMEDGKTARYYFGSMYD